MKTLIMLIVAYLGPAPHLSAQDQKKPIGNLLYEIISAEGLDRAVEKYHELKSDQASEYNFSVQQLNTLGNRLLGENKIKEALRILELNLTAFPEMLHPKFSYADALHGAGQKVLAIQYYREGLRQLAQNDSLPDTPRHFYQAWGNRKIKIIENLNRSADPGLVYHADFGGAPAGNWDVDNLLAFQEKHEGVEINYESNDFYNAPVPLFVHDRFKSEEHPDVVSSFVKGVYRDYVEQGQLADLSALWQAEGWDEIFPPSLKRAVSYNGKPYFVPITFQWNPIWYRKDIFQKLDLTPPKTWSELLTLCETLHEADYLPFTLSGKPWVPPVNRWFVSLTLRLQGANFYNALMKGDLAWTDPRVEEVFYHWQELFVHHAFAEETVENSWQQAVKDLASGKAAMWNIGEWLWEFQPIQQQADNIDFFPMPEIRLGIPKAEIFHLYGAHMFADAKNRQTAEAFLRHLASEDVQRGNHETLKYRTPASIKTYGQMSPLQQRQYDYIKTVDHPVPLMEFNTRPKMATAASQAFIKFWEDPKHEIAAILEQLEKIRLEVFRRELN